VEGMCIADDLGISTGFLPSSHGCCIDLIFAPGHLRAQIATYNSPVSACSTPPNPNRCTPPADSMRHALARLVLSSMRVHASARRSMYDRS